MANKDIARTREHVDNAYDGSDVTPDDVDDLPDGAARALWIGVSGTLRITTLGGTVLDFAAAEVEVGVFPWGARKVHATGTTATNIKAIY